MPDIPWLDVDQALDVDEETLRKLPEQCAM